MHGIIKQMLFFQPHAAIIEPEDWSAPIPVVIPPFLGVRQYKLSGLQLLHRGHPATTRVWPIIVVSPEPTRNMVSDLFSAFEVVPP